MPFQRLELHDEVGSLQVVIRPRRSGFALLLLAGLLLGSAYFLAVLVVSILGHGVTSFTAAMVMVFGFSLAASLFLIGWMAAGREIIRADGEGITHRLAIFDLGVTSFYPASEISGFSVRPETGPEQARDDRLKGSGPLYFEQEGRPVRLGAGLSLTEAEEIAARVLEVAGLGRG